MTKRARERTRQEKQEAKKEKRDARSEEEGPQLPAADESALMEQFARLSEKYSSDQITESDYESERHRIFVELGIESDE
jgi:hypothetical protein